VNWRLSPRCPPVMEQALAPADATGSSLVDDQEVLRGKNRDTRDDAASAGHRQHWRLATRARQEVAMSDEVGDVVAQVVPRPRFVAQLAVD
jgi:hypothetical protein